MVSSRGERDISQRVKVAKAPNLALRISRRSAAAKRTPASVPALIRLLGKNLLVPCAPERSQTHSVGAALGALAQPPAGFRRFRTMMQLRDIVRQIETLDAMPPAIFPNAKRAQACSALQLIVDDLGAQLFGAENQQEQPVLQSTEQGIAARGS